MHILWPAMIFDSLCIDASDHPDKSWFLRLQHCLIVAVWPVYKQLLGNGDNGSSMLWLPNAVPEIEPLLGYRQSMHCHGLQSGDTRGLTHVGCKNSLRIQGPGRSMGLKVLHADGRAKHSGAPACLSIRCQMSASVCCKATALAQALMLVVFIPNACSLTK